MAASKKKAVKKSAKKATTKKSTKKAATKIRPEKNYKRKNLPPRKDGKPRSDYDSRKDRPVLRLDWEGNPIKLTEEERTRKGKHGAMAWTAPEDMPDKQVRQVMAGKMCGAKCGSKPGYCTNRHVFMNKHQMPPYRCKYHGGMTTGAPQGNKHNLRHGLYAAAVLPGEEEAWEEIKAGSLDEEVRIIKLRLRRAIIYEAKLEEALAEGEGEAPDHMVMEVHEEKQGWGPESESYTKKTKKLPDVKTIIHNIVTQLVKLENQRSIMQGGGQDMTPEERAARARAFLAEARASVGSSQK